MVRILHRHRLSSVVFSVPSDKYRHRPETGAHDLSFFRMIFFSLSLSDDNKFISFFDITFTCPQMEGRQVNYDRWI
jgi:hypothetical protein